MQFIDLGAQQARIREGIDARIRAVLDHGKYIMGPEVGELEDKLAKYCDVQHCISCASGTDALLMALMALDIRSGDIIFTTPFTFIATAEVIVLLGAIPVFVDIEADTYNIDPLKLAGAAAKAAAEYGRERLKGIIPVDLFGQPASYREINQVAADYEMFVIEDAAQSFGATYNGKPAGNHGHLAATSFFPAKPLGCYGDGGAVFTNDDVLADKLRSIRVHGQGSHKYDNIRIGINGRCDTIQAAILLEKLTLFDDEIVRRNTIARRYNELLGDAVVTPSVRDDRTSVWAQYSVLADDREAMLGQLKAAGIPAAIYYPKPLHRQEAFAGLGYSSGDMPVTEHAAARIFSLPMHPYLEAADQERICKAVRGGE